MKSAKAKKSIQIISAVLPVLAWASLIFFFSAQSSLPGPTFDLFNYLFKKSAHIFVYFVLWILLRRSFHLLNPKYRYAHRLTFLLVFLYAVSDEIHQGFTPGRYPSPIDVGYDMIGATLASFIYPPRSSLK